MATFLLSTFLSDLREIDEPHFARRVLSKVINAAGQFEADGDDHRYDEIEGGWIRYVSRGSTAYRVIYIRRGADIFLYRAGRHDVEDGLRAPSADRFATAFLVTTNTFTFSAQGHSASTGIANDLGQLLYSSTPTQLKHYIVSLGHRSHREIWLVAPFVTPAILYPTHTFGRLLFKAKEDGAAIGLITKPPSNRDDLTVFERLEAEDIVVAFVERLHAKLYLFELDDREKYRYQMAMTSSAIVGSANLTDAALGLIDGIANEELCYRLPEAKFDEAKRYVAWLESVSKDTKAYRRILR
jgi:hypothetical protein